MEKECQICGIFYEAKKVNQKYCPNCSQRSTTAKKQLERHIKESISRCGTGTTKQPQNNCCKNCKKIFITYEWHPGEVVHEFCSRNCREKYNIAHTFCMQCKKPMSETENQKDVHNHPWFCCQECRQKYRWKIAKEQGEIHVCPECGKEFVKKSKFCSKECYRIYQKKQKIKIRHDMQTVIKSCLICQKDFECSVHNLQIPLCSDECKKKYRKQVQLINAKKKEEIIKKKKEDKEKEYQDYISKNGLCSICFTSYCDCERMQSGFRLSPKGAVFKGSLVVKCPKFTQKHKKLS